MQSDTWVSASQLQAEASRFGISHAMLARLRADGLVARPTGHRSPARALAQLKAIAAARTWTKDPARIRHAIWWNGGRLEDWSQLQADQIRFLEGQATSTRYLAGLSEADRDAEARRLAQHLAYNRDIRFPRGRIRERADRESVAAIFLGLRVGDLGVLLFDQYPQEWPINNPTNLLEALRRGLATPVDDGKQQTLGELLGAAVGAGELPEPGLWATLFLGGWLPDEQEMPDMMRAMTEAKAARTRDLMRAAAMDRPEFDLQRKPEVATILLLTFARMADHVPALLDESSWRSGTPHPGPEPDGHGS
jgi:hypothetical protein